MPKITKIRLRGKRKGKYPDVELEYVLRSKTFFVASITSSGGKRNPRRFRASYEATSDASIHELVTLMRSKLHNDKIQRAISYISDWVTLPARYYQ